jgi:Terminase large subunit, T4likevirus-type, N-terminal
VTNRAILYRIDKQLAELEAAAPLARRSAVRPTLYDVSKEPAPSFITRDRGFPVVHFHPGQWEAYNSDARFTLILAGTRGGKTVTGPWWLLKVMRQKGPGEYLCAAPTYKLLKKGIYKALRRVLVGEMRLGSIIGGAEGEFRFSREGFGRVWPDHSYDDEAKIAFGHAANPDSLEAAEYKAAWLDEPGQRGFPLESWEAIQRRLAIDEGPALLTTTPYVIQHWVKEQIHDPATRVERGVAMPGDEDYKVVRFKSTMNPAFPKAEYDRAKALLPDWKFGLFYDGRFTRPAGAVYDCWDAETMVVPPHEPPAHAKRYVGIDFGAPNFAAVFLYTEPGPELDGPPTRAGAQPRLPDRLTVYREYRPQEARSIGDHVAAMRALEPNYVHHCVGGAMSEEQWRIDFADAGWPIAAPDQPEVEVGIDRVYACIKQGLFRVTADCPFLIEDLGSYSRAVDEAGNVLNDLLDKELAHSADALRYIVGWLNRTTWDFFFRVV